MAKTYNTISTFTSGQILTATQMNQIGTNVNNYRVPPMCRVFRSSNQTGLATGNYITWNAETVDTDSMFTASQTYIETPTAGMYAVSAFVYVSCTATLTWVAINLWRSAGATPTTLWSIARNQSPAYSATAGYVTATAIVPCDAGSRLQVSYDASGGSAHVINGNTTDMGSNDISSFQATWLGQVS